MNEFDRMPRVINPFVYQRIAQAGMSHHVIPPWLHESYSQCYEDVMVVNLVRAYMMRTNLANIKFTYVEIGANHPVCTSSTYLLNRVFGVTGILVEPIPYLATALRKHRPSDYVVEAAVYEGPEAELDFYVHPNHEISSADKGFLDRASPAEFAGISKPIKVKTIKVNDLLAMVKEADAYFLSIDIEGLDWPVITGIDYTKTRPLIIQVEPSEHLQPGTIKRTIDFMKEKNYALLGANFVNLMFHDQDRL